jgi:hypothetical protein
VAEWKGYIAADHHESSADRVPEVCLGRNDFMLYRVSPHRCEPDAQDAARKFVASALTFNARKSQRKTNEIAKARMPRNARFLKLFVPVQPLAFAPSH